MRRFTTRGHHGITGGSLSRGLVAAVAAGAMLLTGALTAPVAAVNADHGQRVVSDDPANFTPHVMDGSVQAIVQIGTRIVAAGTFTTVRQTPTGPDITRNGIFAFDASTGAIDMGFDPDLGGSAKSLDTDGTYVYVGGSFTSVSGQSSTKRVAKLTADGTLVPGFRNPNAAVNEVVVRGDRVYIGGKFTSVGGGTATVARSALAALDKNTGNVLPEVDLPFAGVFNGGTTGITRMDVSPDGTRLVAIGNFLTVAGQAREQIAMIDTSNTGPAALSGWSTVRYSRARNACAPVFDSWMRDIDFSPDGSYFAVTTTGAFAGGAGSGTLCDTTSRWEGSRSGSGQEPTWVDYTGGDTTYGVAATGSAIYVGGHMRWENNSFQGDQAGPGAVPREGIAALDPVNGLPLSWNPGRTKGVGAEALYATPTGLWVGSDTTRIGGELRQRVAFMPLAGGTAVPQIAEPVLPGDLFLATRSGGGAGVIYRVNAAGPALPAEDDGPGWSSDAGFVATGSTASWATSVQPNSAVPGSTPPAIFASERYGTMGWNFPVAAGRPVTVRLYFANQYPGTQQVGQRVFDVRLDGGLVLNDFDIVAAAPGDRVGMMRSFNITSDGNVDIDFSAVVENPLVNAIEIVDSTAPGPTPGTLLRRPVDSAGSPTAPAVLADASMDWSTVRGTFLVNGTLYYGLTDGALYARSFDAATGDLGSQRAVNLHDDPDTGARIPFSIANLSGIFYDTATHRLYYSVTGDSRLYYRYFTPESEVVGAQTFQVATTNGVSFSGVSGMTLAGGLILYGSTADGALRSVPFSAGVVTGPATVVISDGTWRVREMFASPVVAPAPPPPNEAPVAAFVVTCDTQRVCSVDASGSTDSDGDVVGYAWQYGDDLAGTGTGVQQSYTYGADGTYTITLTVTDDDGATSVTTRQVDVMLPPPAVADIAFRGSASTAGNLRTVSVDIPASVQADDVMILSLSQSTARTISEPTGTGPWTRVGAQAENRDEMTTTLWQRVAAAGEAGTKATITLDGFAKVVLSLVAYSGADPQAPVLTSASAVETATRTTHTTPDASLTVPGSWVLSYWSDKSSSTSDWAEPVGDQLRVEDFAPGSGRVSQLITDSNGPVPGGARAGLTATADAPSSKAVMWTLVLQPA